MGTDDDYARQDCTQAPNISGKMKSADSRPARSGLSLIRWGRRARHAPKNAQNVNNWATSMRQIHTSRGITAPAVRDLAYLALSGAGFQASEIPPKQWFDENTAALRGLSFERSGFRSASPTAVKRSSARPPS